MKFGPPDDDDATTIAFEVSTRDRANCWMRVRGTITNRWSGTRRDIDDEISLATVRHPGGGRRWCFICPAQGWRVVSSTCLPGRGISAPAWPTILPTKQSIWTTASGPGGACANAAGSSAAIPMELGEPYPEKPAGMSAARYAYLLDRLGRRRGRSEPAVDPVRAAV